MYLNTSEIHITLPSCLTRYPLNKNTLYWIFQYIYIYISSETKTATSAESSSTFKLFIKPRAGSARFSFLIHFVCVTVLFTHSLLYTSQQPITTLAFNLETIHHNKATNANSWKKKSGTTHMEGCCKSSFKHIFHLVVYTVSTLLHHMGVLLNNKKMVRKGLKKMFNCELVNGVEIYRWHVHEDLHSCMTLCMAEHVRPLFSHLPLLICVHAHCLVSAALI